LFRLLLARLGQRSLGKGDFEALLISIPATSRVLQWNGGVQGDAATQNLSKEALERQASSRFHVEKLTANHHGSDKICTDLAGFKKILIQKYGSLFAAWRRSLDIDQNGVVTQKDFAKSCQKVGVKAVQKVWSELDKNSDGQISLFELDAETSTMFNSLEQLLLERFGDTKEAWRKVFDKKGSLRCDQHAFVRGCQSINFEYDAELLFKLLRAEPGRIHLGYDDLWIHTNINGYELKKAPPPNFTQGSPRSTRSMSPSNRPSEEFLNEQR
jgi:hypothetical protein